MSYPDQSTNEGLGNLCSLVQTPKVVSIFVNNFTYYTDYGQRHWMDVLL
jgi:hypothetical protein